VQKHVGRRKKGNFARGEFRAPSLAVVLSLTDCRLLPLLSFFQNFFLLLLIYFLDAMKKFGDGSGNLGGWVYRTPIF
jgi:hypothetical protein